MASSDVVVPLASVPEGRGLVVRVDARLRIAIFRVGEEIYAIEVRPKEPVGG